MATTAVSTNPAWQIRFWIKVSAGLLVMALALLYVLNNWRVGFSNEAMQSVGAGWFLVHLEPDYSPAIGTYAVFHVGNGLQGFRPGTLFVKLVVGGPGALIHVGVNKTTVNGKVVAGSLDSLSALHLSPNQVVRTFIVPRNAYFVVGTRPYSYDSRYWGTVPVGAFVGKAYLL
ncbi:S26 family signal peptidase [Metallibacterium scheffleri]|uniref:Signal peptidase I n=1 Tax=Metallibacterium scheffleri TaxID=993689 RepID=A0A4S3KQN2_9GAMM|nr:S26 family signal peptidase [Metallibacterium scheffleri]THD11309.1 hypothetical protein B1806_04100 [Metallibacterium scheffleri]